MRDKKKNEQIFMVEELYSFHSVDQDGRGDCVKYIYITIFNI